MVTKSDWEDRYSELEDFKRRNGHCNVSTKSGPLGIWVGTQRTEKRLLQEGKPSSMTEERKNKLEGLGFQWTLVTKSDWLGRFTELVDFKRRVGHCNVTQSSGPLGAWVAKQRQQYRLFREGKPSQITEERITKLKGLGFQWTLKHPEWEDRFAELVDFKRRVGHCNVSQSSGPLGQWVSDQRQQYRLRKEKKYSSMTEERITKLEGLDFQWTLYNRKRKRSEPTDWEDRFAELVDFKRRVGHCNVSQRSGPLGKWVGTQRQQYRLRKEKKHSSMTEERITKLKGLGFQWTLKHPEWEDLKTLNNRKRK